LGHSGRQHIEHVPNGHAESTDARLARAMAGHHNNSGEIFIGHLRLAPAYELDNLQCRSLSDFRSGPIGLADDLAVEFDGYSIGGDLEVFE